MIAAQDIEGLFSRQLARIRSEDLRRKAVEVWVEGCRRGGWETVADLKAMPFTLLTDTRGISLVEHTIAVTEGAVGLAEAQKENYRQMPYTVDMDRLIAGGLLHDVGKLMEAERDDKGGYRKSKAGQLARHPVSGAVLAAQCGMPDEILNIIACHAKEGDGAPKVVETVLIHQADFATFDPMVMLAKKLLIQ